MGNSVSEEEEGHNNNSPSSIAITKFPHEMKIPIVDVLDKEPNASKDIFVQFLLKRGYAILSNHSDSVNDKLSILNQDAVMFFMQGDKIKDKQMKNEDRRLENFWLPKNTKIKGISKIPRRRS